MKKLWIVFEGLDGSGKTTQAKLLCDYLNKNRIKTIYTHVFDTEIGGILKNIFINIPDLSELSEILLLCLSRELYLKKYNELKYKYDIIITDRFFWSILSMQGSNANNYNIIKYLEKIIMKESDDYFTVYIDTSPEICKKRCSYRNELDRIELKNIEFHKKVYDHYKMLVGNNNNVIRINGNRSIIEIQKEIIEEINKILR